MASPLESATPTAIAADTLLGAVRLTVSDIDRSRAFYEQAIGLRAHERPDGAVSLGPNSGHPLIELSGDPNAQPLNRRATGLYHVAILVPSRRDLAFALARLADARWRLDGASDHLVSEALYLSDPDGNGIEIYRDRPRDEWPRSGGQLQMATEPLDIEGVIGEIRGAHEQQEEAPPATTVGHVHLQVSNLEQTEHFYHGVLGFDVTVRRYPGALFLSAGGYHHHIGANTWHSAGAHPPAPGSVGLRNFEMALPSREELGRVLERVRADGLTIEDSPWGALVRDPSGNGVVLRTAGG